MTEKIFKVRITLFMEGNLNVNTFDYYNIEIVKKLCRTKLSKWTLASCTESNQIDKNESYCN